VDSRHFENLKLATSQQLFYRLPQYLARWRTMPLRTK